MQWITYVNIQFKIKSVSESLFFVAKFKLFLLLFIYEICGMPCLI